MSIQVLMPALSPTMEEGTIAKWLVRAGDRIKPGDVIAEIETDKATMEVEAVDEGIVSEILIPEGTQNVKVNEPIAVVLGDEDDAPQAPAAKVVQKDPAKAAAPAKTPARAPSTPAPQKAYSGPTTQLSVRDALRDAMAEEMRRDSSVFLMGEEVGQYQGAYKVSRGLLEEFGPKRVVDTPITEHGFTGVGVGAAFTGLRPIVEFMTFNFAMQAIDQIINSAAKTLYMSGGQLGCPIVFRGPNGAAARVGAQHSQDFSAWYAQIPGLKVVAPYDAADAKALLKAAIRDPNPVIFLEHELLYNDVAAVPIDPDYTLPIGHALVRLEGSDVTITAHSRMVGHALKAAATLAEQGISAEVVDLRSLRPLDSATVVRSVMKTNRLVAAEEGWGSCGVGAEVIARVIDEAFDYLDAPPLRVHQADAPLPYAANLEALSLPNADDIVQAVLKVCGRS